MSHHIAIITQVGATGYLLASPPEGYLVTCPHGCNLGTTARQATRKGAEHRVTMHQVATEPLIPFHTVPAAPYCKCCTDNECECGGTSIGGAS